MARFPEPPAPEVLASLGPDVAELGAGTPIWRVYFQAGAHPTTWNELRAWGPTDARFDHHLPPPRAQDPRILYGALGPVGAVTALAEVFQATGVLDREDRSPCLVAFAPTRALRLLDLTGTWPTRAGASMAIASGPRARARRWAQACHAAFPDLDGLLYPSSMHAHAPCVALTERAASALPGAPLFHRLLADPVLLTALKNACHRLGYLLV